MAAANADQVLQHIQHRQQALIELLRHMVDAESPSSHPGAHHLIISILNEALSSIDYKVYTTGSNGTYRHIYARRKTRSKNQRAQLLLGHYDTVWPLGTVARRPR